MPGKLVGMDRGAMPRVAMAGTRGLCSRAEPGWWSEAKGGKAGVCMMSSYKHVWP